MDLYKKVEQAFNPELFREKSTLILDKYAPLKGNIDCDKLKYLKNKVELVKEAYTVESDLLDIYGYLTWYLTLQINKYQYNNRDSDLNFFEILLMDCFDLEEYFFVNEDSDFITKLHNCTTDWIEYIHQYSITKEEIIKELQGILDHSNRRLECGGNGMTQSIIDGLGFRPDKFQQHINHLKTIPDNCQIVRVNRLGDYVENGSQHYSEVSMYFILDNENLYVLRLSDIA